MGLQFENIILANSELICELLNIELVDIVSDGSYFKRGNNLQQGCQIDYLIQTKMNTLYVCEVKFLGSAIQDDIVVDVKRKIQALQLTKQFTCLPVLIHIGELSQPLIDLHYFYRIINLADLY